MRTKTTNSPSSIFYFQVNAAFTSNHIGLLCTVFTKPCLILLVHGVLNEAIFTTAACEDVENVLLLLR